MSLYNGKETAEDDRLLECVKHLQMAFPTCVNMDFCLELVRQAKLMELPYDQLDDSVNWLIRHHRYQNLTIADVLDYDVKLTIYTYNQVKKLEGGAFNDDTKTRYKHWITRDGNRLFVKYEQVMMLPDKFRERIINEIRQNEQINYTAS